MNILIVTAHPSSKGDTHTIADIYARVKREKGHNVELVDLYAKEYEVPLLKFENIREFPLSDVQKKFQQQIMWADEIVAVHPIWWSSVPAVMKNWLDLTIWPRIAYSYNSNGTVNKLLLGKTAKVFATCGGPAWYYHLPFILPLRTFWETCIFSFSGIDLVDIKVCGNMDKWKDEKRAKHLAKFLKKVEMSAKS